jgi:hypothetical protein
LTTKLIKTNSIFEPDTERNIEEEEFYKSNTNFYSKDGAVKTKALGVEPNEGLNNLQFFKQQIDEANRMNRYKSLDDMLDSPKEDNITFQPINENFTKKNKDVDAKANNKLDDEISVGSISIDD